MQGPAVLEEGARERLAIASSVMSGASSHCAGWRCMTLARSLYFSMSIVLCNSQRGATRCTPRPQSPPQTHRPAASARPIKQRVCRRTIPAAAGAHVRSGRWRQTSVSGSKSIPGRGVVLNNTSLLVFCGVACGWGAAALGPSAYAPKPYRVRPWRLSA